MQTIHFIVGTGRCGTNLLARMLGAHPQLLSVAETHFISTLATKFAETDLSPEDFWQILNEHYTSNGEYRWLDAHLRDARTSDKEIFKTQFIQHCHDDACTTHKQRVIALLSACYQKNTPDEKRYIIDKTPQYGLHTKAISHLFPSSKFIHIIRDGRFVATSMAKHKGISRLIAAGHPDELQNFSYQAALSHTAPLQITLEQAILYWQKIVSEIQKQATGLPASQYLEIRYEDLIVQPYQILRQVCDFLDLPFGGVWYRKAALMPDPHTLSRSYRQIRHEVYNQLTDLVKLNLQQNGYPTTHLNEDQNKVPYQPHYLKTRDTLRRLLNVR